MKFKNGQTETDADCYAEVNNITQDKEEVQFICTYGTFHILFKGNIYL
jgi:hypothetical protein